MKTTIKILCFTLLVTIITSCGSKKTIVEKEYITEIDTIREYKDRYIYKQVNDTIIIEDPCDSLGILKPFKAQIKTNQGKVNIENKNGKIQAEVNLDSIVSVYENKYKSKVKEVEVIKEVEVVRYKTDYRVIILLVFSLLVNVYFIKNRFF